jgi:sugar transferase EpsL
MLKRIFDVFFSLLLLIIFAPLIIALGLLIRLKMGAPVLFRQQRPGLRDKPFYLFKLRTMSEETDREGNILDDQQRLTVLGRQLRKYSLDELPQLFNVLKGELSFVGPRPLLMSYLERYSPEQARRHEVKPGITGWAQVNGRNVLTWEEKFALDVWYVDNQNLWLDLKILWLTLVKVFKAEGISQEGWATMPEFMGPEIKKNGNK